MFSPCMRAPAAIIILDGPTDATVTAGDEVTFNCMFIGTLDLPLWNIGGTIYRSSLLPAGFRYMDKGLHIASVWESLNNTIFVCLFIVDDGGSLSYIESSPAYLVVYHRLSGYGRRNSGDESPQNGPTPTVNLTSARRENSQNCTNKPVGTATVSQGIGKSYLHTKAFSHQHHFAITMLK